MVPGPNVPIWAMGWHVLTTTHPLVAAREHDQILRDHTLCAIDLRGSVAHSRGLSGVPQRHIPGAASTSLEVNADGATGMETPSGS